MRRVRGRRLGSCLVLGAFALAGWPAGAHAYAEYANWLNAYGRTLEHFSQPDRSASTIAASAKAIADTLLLEADRLPDRGVQQFGAWPWSGDPECGTYRDAGSHGGQRLEFFFTNRSGQRLKATLYEPAGLAPGKRAAGVVYSGGVISAEPMYCWFAHGMAKAGYLAMTYDVSGQGKSDGSSAGDAADDLRDALDFFASTPKRPYAHAAEGDDYRFNPLHLALDRRRIGDAGHSMGAGAVQRVGSHGGLVKAISAHSDLGFGDSPEGDTTPVQGQGADYESFIFPPQPEPDFDPDAKIAPFREIRAATPTRDVMEVVIESGTHMAWSHVTWAYSASWSEQVAFHYALAWFDRYLLGDARRAPDGTLGTGPTATQRLTTNLEVDEAGHGVSKKYRSAYSLAKIRRGVRRPAQRWVCEDVVGRAGCTAPSS